MKRLHDYLDYDSVKVITKSGEEYIGVPVAVNYADETVSGEEEITIENEALWGFTESEIDSIEIIDVLKD